MCLWKYAFELASKDLDLLRRKKQALDDLLSSNRISQQTYECLDKEISDALSDVKRYLENLSCKMRNRAESLEKQVGILEIFLANIEILHAAGEIDDETYERQSKAVSLGLESTVNEINEIKRALESVAPKPVEEVKCEGKIEAPSDVSPMEESVPAEEKMSEGIPQLIQ
ncbi:MAG: CdvA-like protein [Candidatus Bathyarchaeota archaeon]|nr:CdvA-like protein [Candidatus Bathyarchaeota archaeon]